MSEKTLADCLLPPEEMAAACAAAAWSPAKHHILHETLARVDGLPNLRFVTQRDHFSPQPGRLLEADGREIAPDYRAWAKGQLEALGGDAEAIWRKYNGKNWTVTQWRWALRYYWQQVGTKQWDGVQVELVAEQEYSGARLFDDSEYARPRDEVDVLNHSCPGPAPAAVQPLAPGRYRMKRGVDMARFVEIGTGKHAAAIRAQGARTISITDSGGNSRTSTIAEAFPQTARSQWLPRRWFDDWQYSSAGRAGHLAGHRWAYEVKEWEMAGIQGLNFIPLWSHTAKIAKIETRPLNDHELYGRLLKLSERTGDIPFHWYFYMLHGNLLNDAAGRRVLKAAEKGEIVLPEHDYQVLKHWNENPYGF